MFEVNTTLVLGAGASVGYGFPLGNQLIDKMITRCPESQDGLGEEAKQRRKLRESLKFYDPLSIDSFLQHYKETDSKLVEYAKAVISEVLHDSAKPELFNRTVENSRLGKYHWYRIFWNSLVAGKTAEELSSTDADLNFNVISFNYDPSLEFFFYSRSTSRNSFLNEAQRIGFLKNLAPRIHHVYGCIQDYDWIRRGGKDSNVKYGYEKNQRDSIYYDAYENRDRIKLIDERKGSYDHLKEILRNSDQIIFLGFAFDDVNIGAEVLDLKESLKPTNAHRILELGRSLPIIKYTNLENSELINNKLNSIVDGVRRLYKSTKTVYEAIEQDFRLNGI